MMRGKGRRPNSYNSIKWFKETKKGVDITMPGSLDPAGQNLRLKLTASFEDISDVAAYATVPTKSAFKALFGRYCITGVKYTFIPKFSVTSAGVANQASDRVIYAINRDPNSQVGNEEQILRQNDAKFTNTSRKFTIYVKHPEPILYSTAGDANKTPSQMPVPTGGGAGATNQVSALPSQRKWIWLPTRYGYGDMGTTQQAPDHVGADVHITCMNPQIEQPYVVYTMFKTVYFAFKEQD